MQTMFSGFLDRADAGRGLAKALAKYRGSRDAIVLGLPRGGVVTAAPVAKELGLPLDVLVVRKLGVPRHEELAMGAIGPGSVRVLNEDVLSSFAIDPLEVEFVASHERAELERRERLYRGHRRPLALRGKTVIVVDDGVATGSTMFAALAVIRSQEPARLVLAVPVAAARTCDRFRTLVDELVCLLTPEPFYSVGYWYIDFARIEDDEVLWTLEVSRLEVPALARASRDSGARKRDDAR